jgi:cephalosporin hydroxylase
VDPIEQFFHDCDERVTGYVGSALAKDAAVFLQSSIKSKYSYNFKWLGRPIIQYPQDIVAMQELIWKTQPDLIIEAGIAHGGSLILSASLLALMDYADAVQTGGTLDPKAGHRRVLGLDVDIRSHNRAAIETHPMAHKIRMIQGSSIEPSVIAQVQDFAKNYSRILVCLDSNHTHDHVLSELEAYAPLTSRGSYCVVFDTVIEDLSDDMFPDRPWKKGNSPKSAVREYMKRIKDSGRTASDGGSLLFEVDKDIENKLLVTVAPDGYLKRI